MSSAIQRQLQKTSVDTAENEPPESFSEVEGSKKYLPWSSLSPPTATISYFQVRRRRPPDLHGVTSALRPLLFAQSNPLGGFEQLHRQLIRAQNDLAIANPDPRCECGGTCRGLSKRLGRSRGPFSRRPPTTSAPYGIFPLLCALVCLSGICRRTL